jgi:hypothetical protein
MKVRLRCTLMDEKGRQKVGEPGDVMELEATLAKSLLAGGSAELLEPPKRSERD